MTVKVCVLIHCHSDRIAVRLHNSIQFNLQLLEAIREGHVSNLAAALRVHIFLKPLIYLIFSYKEEFFLSVILGVFVLLLAS